VNHGALPNLIIIGAMKCATTSLHFYLDRHPEISMSRQKELNFFSWEEVWERGEEWYRTWFDPGAPVRGEASPSYSNFPRFKDVPARMQGLVPKAKLIYLVRDPLRRLLSHYRHLVAERKENRPLSEVLSSEEHLLVTRSLFAFQLEQYLPFFPLEQILVVQQERLLADRQAEMSRIFSFLGVNPAFRTILFRRRRHRSVRKRRKTDLGLKLSRLAPATAISNLPDLLRWPIEDILYYPFSRRVDSPKIPADLLDDLHARFREDATRLRELTGQRFEGWVV
jgi:hypothetical protein